MKKMIFFVLGVLVGATGFTQSDKYVKTMETKVAALDTTRNTEALKEIGNAFERIGDAEKTQWLPYYYAALAHLNSGYFQMNGQMGGMAAQMDPIADKAEQLISKAEALSKDNSEIYVIRKMIASLRLMADPMARYMQYGPQAQQALETAKKLNPENPRVYLLEGQDKYYTPEQFGGSKTEAKALLEEALKKFDAFRAANALEPRWGKGTTEYFLSQIK
jgi:hypothetical protein